MSYANKVEKFLIRTVILDKTTGDSYDVSSGVKAVNVKRDYMENSFPLFVIDFKITEDVRDAMRDDDITVSLKIYEYNANTQEDNDDNEDSSDIVSENVYLDTIILPYIKPYEYTNTYEEEDTSNTASETQSSSLPYFNYEVIGIPETLITKNKSVVNAIYEKANMDSIVINLLTPIANNTIYMDASDNKTRLDSLLVPPMNIIPALRWLDSSYGIYTGPMNIFFDFNKTYVYEVLHDRSQSYTNVMEINTESLTDLNDDTKLLTPQYDSTNGNIRLILKVAPSYVNRNKIVYDTLGETSIFNSYDDNFDLVSRIKKHTDETTNEKIRYFWNGYKTKLLEDRVEKVAKGEAISVILSNLTPDYAGVDTLYNVNTDVDYINGTYNLIENTFSMTSNDQKHFSCTTILKLIKIK